MRFLGLDVGDKTIGVAVSDPSKTIAQGVGQIKWSKFAREDVVKRIRELISQYEVDKIVTGLPKNVKGEEGFQAKKVQDFLAYLSLKVRIPIVLVDERFSTVIAESILREAKTTLSKRKKNIDKISAAIILQSYLDSQAFKCEEMKDGF